MRLSGPVGRLTLTEERDRETMRTLRVARMKSWELGDRDVVPPLFDAALIHAGDTWTMTGWERGEALEGLHVPAFQQSWWLVPLKLSEQVELARERHNARVPG